ncbi:MAG: hypothetical protein HPY66_1481 [Firmicutes bacterium]|nr:hypothetical protein [Bacillota bacterium]
MDRLPVRVKLIIAITVLLAIACGVFFSDTWQADKDIWKIIFFITLAIVGESLSIALPNQVTVSVVFAISVCIIMLFPPFTAALMLATANSFALYRRDGKNYHIFNTPFYKTAFNVSNFFIASLASAIAYRVLYTHGGDISLPHAMIPVAAASFIFLAINTSLVTLLISNLLNQGFRSIWNQNVKWTIQNYLIMSPLGVILAIAYQNYGYIGVLLFFGPLLMARYSFKLYMDLKRSYLETVEALSRALEAKDPVTSGHAERVGEYAVAIAEELKLSESRIDKIRYAALLHDIGKIGIADGVLNKEGMLSTEEFAQIREHPVIGSEILKDIDFLREASKIIRHHHERYDGRGYPDGLKGDEVPIEAYILAVADAFDAMTNDRPYRKALPVDKARSIIAEEAGRQFHPKVADALIKTLDKGLFNVAY